MLDIQGWILHVLVNMANYLLLTLRDIMLTGMSDIKDDSHG